MSLGTAFRAFFAALSSRDRSEAIRELLDAEPGEAKTLPAPTEAAPPAAPTPAAPKRSEALTLLATLQREARLIDLVEEPLDQFTDAQVGAAARPCLKQCRAALDRMFSLRPVVDVPEGETLTPPEDASPIRYQWVGESGDSGQAGSASRRSGRIVHPGWRAERVELAQWTGSDEDAMVIAAAQLQP